MHVRESHIFPNVNFIFPGLSMLQNGPVPKFFDESTLNRLFSNNSSEEFESACVHNLKKGLDCLGLIKVNDDKLCGICCLLHQTHISNKNLYTYCH